MFPFAWFVTIEAGLLAGFIITCAFGRICRQQSAIHESWADHWGRRAAHRRELTARYIHLAEEARGERARRFYRNRAARTGREVDEATTRTARHATDARIWKILG